MINCTPHLEHIKRMFHEWDMSYTEIAKHYSLRMKLRIDHKKIKYILENYC